MTDQLDQALLLSISEAFDMYDADLTGTIPLSAVPLVLRTVGLTVPQARIDAIALRKARQAADASFTERHSQAVAARAAASTTVPTTAAEQENAEPQPAWHRVALADEYSTALYAVQSPADVARDAAAVSEGLQPSRFKKRNNGVSIRNTPVTLRELLTLLGSEKAPELEEDEEEAADARRQKALRDALALFDSAQTGYVAVADVKKALERPNAYAGSGKAAAVGASDVDKLIAAFDPEKTGRVPYEALAGAFFV
jgi:Ca2+-binding EF-hand superfamily protein